MRKSSRLVLAAAFLLAAVVGLFPEWEATVVRPSMPVAAFDVGRHWLFSPPSGAPWDMPPALQQAAASLLVPPSTRVSVQRLAIEWSIIAASAAAALLLIGMGRSLPTVDPRKQARVS